jgi:hypothetical protein
MFCRIEDPETPGRDARVKVEIRTESDLLIAYLTPEAVGLLKRALDRAWTQIEENPSARVVAEYRL